MDIIEDIGEIRELYGEPTRARGQEAIAAARKAFARLYRAVAVSGHRLGRCFGPARCLAKGRRAGLCPCARRRDPADPGPARQQPGRYDLEPAGQSGGRADLFRARPARDIARQRPRPDHGRSGTARSLRGQRQGAAQRHPGDRRGSLFPLRQGADPLRSVEPGEDAEALGFSVAWAASSPSRSATAARSRKPRSRPPRATARGCTEALPAGSAAGGPRGETLAASGAACMVRR